MQDILDKAKRFKLADIKTINNTQTKLAQLRAYQSVIDRQVPFIACTAMDNTMLANFINCYNTGSSVMSSKTIAKAIAGSICAENAVFFGVPEACESEEKDKEIIETAASADCVVFLSGINTPNISPSETYALKLLSKAIEQYPHIAKRIIFVLQSDYASSQPTEEDIEKRRCDIETLLNTDEIEFFTFFSSLGLDGKKHHNEKALENSGILAIREHISCITHDIFGTHIMMLLEKRKSAKNAANEFLAQMTKRLNVIYNVLSVGENIQGNIQSIINKYKTIIQTTLSSELAVFESVPESAEIVLEFTPPELTGYKSKRKAYTAAKNAFLPMFSSLQETVYTYVTDAAAEFRAALRYANPDYNCFVHIIHVALNCINDCIDELQDCHINLSKARFAAPIQFRQEKDFLERVKYFERDMRDYIIPANKPLEAYLAKLTFSKNSDGQGLFGINKYSYSIDNIDSVIADMQDELNNNLKANKEVVWRAVQFEEQKFLNSFRADISSRISALETAALKVYKHPQTFKDLEHEREVATETLENLENFLKTL